jgi:hypothetical protein
MQLATTLQFREEVRNYIAEKDLRSRGSFTNPSAPGHRTVGFMIPGATSNMAEKIEEKLNKKGLTAKVRCTGDGYSSKSPSGFVGGSHTYIRGTCVFAD